MSGHGPPSGLPNPFAAPPPPRFSYGNPDPLPSVRASAFHPQAPYAQPVNGYAPLHPPAVGPEGEDRPLFDIFEWYPAYQSCQRHFLDHSQHEYTAQVLFAFMNIKLPRQWPSHPLYSSASDQDNTSPNANAPLHMPHQPSFPSFATSRHFHQFQNPAPAVSPAPSVSLYPYIRRLVVTGYDTPPVLLALFGDEWQKGVGCTFEMERRNYLLAAKSLPWAHVKAHYDEADGQTVPFLKAPIAVRQCEIVSAEMAWSDWLYLKDWECGLSDGSRGGEGTRDANEMSANASAPTG